MTPQLVLQCAEPHELVAQRFHRLLSRLSMLGIPVDRVEHLELGDVALPLDVLEQLVAAVDGAT